MTDRPASAEASLRAGRPRAVLWDMDGVIVDSGMYHFQSWQGAFRNRGIAFTDDDFRRVFGMRSPEIIYAFMGEAVTAEAMNDIFREKEETYRSLIKGKIRALPGVKALLAGLERAGFRQALVTSTPIENVDLITGALGIRRYFAHIVSGQDVTEGKPSPQGYLLAAAKLGVAPGDCVVIEDAVAGVAAARNAGMKCLAVTTTNPAEKLGGADSIVGSLGEVGVTDIEGLVADSSLKRSAMGMQRSLVLVKPDAMKRNLAGAIISRFEQKGMRAAGMKLLHMDEALAKRHYAVHQARPFFDSLVKYITSTPIVAVVFEGENAIEVIRKTMGATDPAKAEKGTIRADFGVDIQNNCVHGSDSPENAAKEIDIFFRPGEIHSY